MKRALYALLLCITAIALPAMAIDVGSQPPEFGLASNRGRTVKLSDFRGRVVFIDFWASWCTSCRHSLPWMTALQKKFGPDRFQVIAVNLDDNRDAAEKFLAEMQGNLLVGYDPEGRTPEAYGVKAMPTSILVSSEGMVEYIHEGFSENDADNLEQKIRQLLERKKVERKI